MSTSKIAALAAAQSLVALPYAKEFSHIYFEILGLIVEHAAPNVATLSVASGKNVKPKATAPATPAATSVATPAPTADAPTDAAAEKKRKHALKMQSYRKNKKKAAAKAAKAATVVAVA